MKRVHKHFLLAATDEAGNERLHLAKMGFHEFKQLDRKKISHFNFRSIFLRIAEEAEDSLDQWPIVMALSKATEKMEEASVGI
ncbi:Serine/threonine-protein kinase [Trichinella spiralis]|uniref:Serine/threonine-protein kinase n=1 Tax=Trichinella spiralis TaxID=6334 RepID=A0ABR3KUS4_TRISP